MSQLKGLWSRLHAALRPRAAEDRMEEEFAFHLEMEEQRLRASGRSAPEARREAAIAFGGVEARREEMRQGRAARWIHDFAADLRYGFRGLRRRPVIALAVAASLGAGIGVNVLAYGFLDSLLVRPIPARDAGELIGLFIRDQHSHVRTLTGGEYTDLRKQTGALAAVAGVTASPVNLVIDDTDAPVAAWAEMVTPNYFSTLDMTPAIGRFFSEATAQTEAVLSYACWLDRFGGDPAVAGRVIQVNGRRVAIAGVAPRAFRGMRKLAYWPEIWMPSEPHTSGSLLVFARMHGSGGVDSAIAAATTGRNPDLVAVPAESGFEHPQFIEPMALARSLLLALLGSALTLCVVAANLIGLQVARARFRAREIAIRLSLGCSRSRLVRQLTTEAIVFSAPAVLCAALVVWCLPYFERAMIPAMPFRVGLELSPNGRIAAFTALVTAVAVLLVGLIPAIRATRPPGRFQASMVTQRPRGIRAGLVAGQLALAILLLAGALLLGRSLMVARTADRGFDARDRLLASVNLSAQAYDAERARHFYDRTLGAVRRHPSVVAASWVFPAPFDTQDRKIALVAETDANAPAVRTEVSVVADDFESALGLKHVAGRGFAPTDSIGTARVLMVSESLAARLWGGSSPLGKTARLVSGGDSGPPLTVVGIVGDAEFQVLGGRNLDRAYLPLRQHHRDWQTLAVHTRADSSLAIPELRSLIASIDASVPVFGATSLDDAVVAGLSAPRAAAQASALFAALSLLIAAVGLYALIVATVVDRRQEIGVRLALGSTRRQMTIRLMRIGVRLALWSLVPGVAGAVLIGQMLAGMLFGVPALDPIALFVAPATLLVIVLVVTFLPARQAANLDPLSVLRSE